MKTFCVSLNRRPERWQQFLEELPEDFPWEVERYPAIDGQKTHVPSWWKQGRGAWGCYKSHLNILEFCLNNDIDRCLFLEDDCRFVEEFTARYTAFIQSIPEDWDMVYLGGQHLHQNKKPPIVVNELAVNPYNVNRTHAYMVQGTEFMRELYKHLQIPTEQWTKGFHIDHHYGRLLQRRNRKIYAPRKWLALQRENQSDIAGKRFGDRTWDLVDDHSRLPNPFVMVVGTHSSGSSALARALHAMGVHMGNNFVGYWDGGGEAQGLARMCEQIMPFPTTDIKWNEMIIRQKFYKWCKDRTGEAMQTDRLAGGKYPHLCVLGPHMAEALDRNVKIIHIERPLDESIKSLQRRCPQRDPHALRRLQEFLYEKKGWVHDYDHLNVDWDVLKRNPRAVLGDVYDWLQLEGDLSAGVDIVQTPGKTAVTA